MWFLFVQLAVMRLVFRVVAHVLRVRLERERAAALRVLMEASAETRTEVQTALSGRTMMRVTPVGAVPVTPDEVPGDEG